MVRCMFAEPRTGSSGGDQSRSRWRGQLGPLVGKEEEVSKFEFRKGQERVPTLTSPMPWPPNVSLKECSLHTRDLYNFLATIFSGGLMERLIDIIPT